MHITLLNSGSGLLNLLLTCGLSRAACPPPPAAAAAAPGAEKRDELAEGFWEEEERLNSPE